MNTLNSWAIWFTQIMLVVGVIYNAVQAGLCASSSAIYELRAIAGMVACVLAWCSLKLIWPGF